MRTTKEVVIHLDDSESITIKAAGTEVQIESLDHLGFIEIILPDHVSGMNTIGPDGDTWDELAFARPDGLSEEVRRLRLITFTPDHPYRKDIKEVSPKEISERLESHGVKGLNA